jgi:hypothetical protein
MAEETRIENVFGAFMLEVQGLQREQVGLFLKPIFKHIFALCVGEAA